MERVPRSFSPINLKDRFPALDGIRALAITLVFILHYGGGTHGGGLMYLFNAVRLRGWIGVDLFFVLSGFLITGILYDTQNDPRFFRLFFARRSLRIFPVFYLVAVVLLLLTPVFGYQWRWGHLPFLFYLGNFSALSDPSLNIVHSMYDRGGKLSLEHLWSLCVEEQFYLLWPLLVWWVRDRIKLIRAAAGLAAVAMTLRIFLLLQPGGEDLQKWIPHTLPTRMDTLLIGAILALVLRGPNADRWQRACKWIFLSGLAATLAIFIASPGQDSTALVSVGYTFIALAAAGLIGCALRNGSTAYRLFHLRPLRILGKYSYGFYIFHLLYAAAWVELSDFAGARLHSGPLGRTLVMAANALVTLLVAKLSYDLFEVRFLRYKRHFEYSPEAEKQPYVLTTR
jgi:peptidoglycan/LPS O-acetylase OafA/YrhL